MITKPDARRMWRWVVGLWLASRVAVIAAGVVLTDQLGWHRALAHWQVQPWTAVTGWDTAYYIELSHNGYHHNLSVAFFPLFPAAIWLVREVLHTGDAVTAMLVSNGAALIAMFGLYVLARDRLSEAHARRTLLYLVLSPYAFALVFAYSEGIFLALTVWLFVLSDRRKDGWAIPLAFLTGLTRITGAALVPALLIRAWRRKTVEAWLLAIAPAVGLAAHAAWLWHAVGDPLAMVKIQSEWGGHLSFPLWPLVDQFWRFATTHDVFYLARGVTVIAYLLLLIPIWKSVRFRANRDEDVVYVCAIFIMPLLSSVLYSVGRFGLVAFPLMFALADLGLRRVTVHRAYVVFAPTIQFLLLAAAALGYRPP